MPDREETITESIPSPPLQLTTNQAESLNQLGRKLASRRTWWGADQDEDEGSRPAQIVRCRRLNEDRWEITVSDAVGEISVGDLHIIVEPKIPTRHFVHLLEASGHVPQLDEMPTLLTQSRSLWDLVALWYVSALERLLRTDLIRDYRRANEALSVVRGRVNARKTIRDFLSGESHHHLLIRRVRPRQPSQSSAPGGRASSHSEP
jgi:hypothetical protein